MNAGNNNQSESGASLEQMVRPTTIEHEVTQKAKQFLSAVTLDNEAPFKGMKDKMEEIYIAHRAKGIKDPIKIGKVMNDAFFEMVMNGYHGMSAAQISHAKSTGIVTNKDTGQKTDNWDMITENHLGVSASSGLHAYEAANDASYEGMMAIQKHLQDQVMSLIRGTRIGEMTKDIPSSQYSLELLKRIVKNREGLPNMPDSFKVLKGKLSQISTWKNALGPKEMGSLIGEAYKAIPKEALTYVPQQTIAANDPIYRLAANGSGAHHR